jgi:hypothetical protein
MEQTIFHCDQSLVGMVGEVNQFLATKIEKNVDLKA